MQIYETDVLVIGAGIAGRRAAIEASRSARTLVVSRGKPSSFYKLSPTRGMQVPDDPDGFVREALAVGLGEADEKLVRILATEARERFEELRQWGVRFMPNVRVPGCFSRTPSAVVIEDLDNLLSSLARVPLMEGVHIAGLVTSHGRFAGAVGVLDSGEPVGFRARAGVLAGGGAGGLFRNSLTPPKVIGSSYVLASEAGAAVRNLEFFQIMIGTRGDFYDKERFAARPKIRDARGRVVGADVPPEAWQRRSEHFPFSMHDGSGVIDLAIAKAAERGGAWLDDVPVAPYAHAFNGGCLIDERGETSVRGLFACGEAAAGMHGANRIGGAMLTASVVFGKRAGEFAAQVRDSVDAPLEPNWKVDPHAGLGEGELENFQAMLRELMTSKALVVRRRQDVADALGIPMLVDEVLTHKGVRDAGLLPRYLEVRTMARASRMILQAILARPQTKGPHYIEA